MKYAKLNIVDAEQGTLDWKRARLGKWTATRIKDLMTKGRGKDEVFGDSAKTMMAEVAGERGLDPGMVADDEQFQEWCDLQCRENSAMRHGHQWEAAARSIYEIDKDRSVQECGMVIHPKHKTLAASPDGLVLKSKGDVEGVVEIKCPSTNKTYQRYRWFIKDGDTLKAEVPQYYWQVQNVMNVTGAKWADFIVYSPFHVEDLLVVRIERNEDDIALINERVELAEKYMEELTYGAD